MKKIILSLLLIAPLFWTSCDVIEDNEQIIPPKGLTTEKTPITNTESEQRILLEDFTGWLCVNCPRAAHKAHELLEKYDGQLIISAVHATAFAKPNAHNNNLDFRTDYGEEWAKDFGCISLPTGVFNRTRFGESYTIGDAQWDAKTQELLDATPHLIDINLGAEYKTATNQVLVSCEVVANQEVNFPTLISVFLLEDKIIGIQKNVDPTYGAVPEIDGYEFNHVLRGEGIDDYFLSNNTLEIGSVTEKNFLLEVDSRIQNIENCTALVFVTNADTKEVIQANTIYL